MPGIRGLDAAVPKLSVRIDDVVELKEKRAARVSQPAGRSGHLHTSLDSTPIAPPASRNTTGSMPKRIASVPLEDYRKMFHEYRGG